MLSVLQWFIGLGSTVFLPIIIFILGIIFGVKPAKAAISGFTVGIGSIGLNLVIGLLSDNLGTAIQVMGEHYGFSLNIMDIGCGVGGPLAFSTTLGICIILISLGLNLVFVMLGWTKTLNVDIWNFWFPAFLGLVANAISGSFWVGLLGIIVALMIQWLLADLFQEKIFRATELSEPFQSRKAKRKELIIQPKILRQPQSASADFRLCLTLQPML